jgi:copper homeostasis protein
MFEVSNFNIVMNSENSHPENLRLEVIACSLQDAAAAEAGGAHRLELISHFEVGGLTPALQLVDEVMAQVKIPVRVMLRESEPFEVNDADERCCLRQLARALSEREIDERRVDGIVCGFLRGDQIDHDFLSDILSCAPQMKFTFHRAFEELTDPVLAIEQLKRYPQIDRILMSGAPGSDKQRVQRLNQCLLAAYPEIEILAGGGLEEDFIRLLRKETSLREFHVGRLVRAPAMIDGIVSAKLVRRLLDNVILSADQA